MYKRQAYADPADQRGGEAIHQFLGKDKAPMRGIDGGEGGHISVHAQMGNGVTGIETSLGVGDDIYLAAAGLGDYFLNLVSKLGGAFRYRSGGLLFAVIEDGAVAGEFFWDCLLYTSRCV